MKPTILIIIVLVLSRTYGQNFNKADIPIESSLNPSLELTENSIYISPRDPTKVVNANNAYFFDGNTSMKPGVYFCEILSNNETKTLKILCCD